MIDLFEPTNRIEAYNMFLQDEELGQLRAAIKEALDQGETYQSIADRTFINWRTIRSFFEGDTKCPIPFTQSQIWKALGKGPLKHVDKEVVDDANAGADLLSRMTSEQRAVWLRMGEKLVSE